LVSLEAHEETAFAAYILEPLHFKIRQHKGCGNTEMWRISLPAILSSPASLLSLWMNLKRVSAAGRFALMMEYMDKLSQKPG
jgi:hypothetical protein